MENCKVCSSFLRLISAVFQACQPVDNIQLTMNVQLNLLVFGLSYLIVALMACLGNLYGIRKIYEMMKVSV